MRVQKNAEGIYDFDALVVEPRIIQVGGERADVSMMPVAVSLALAKHSDRSKEEILALAEADSEGELRGMMQMVSDVCTADNPKLAVDFLMKHLGGPKLMAFVKFILQPMTIKAEEFLESEEENAETDETTSD